MMAWAAVWVATLAPGLVGMPLDEALDTNRVDISVLPAAGYSADNGFGAGALAGVYWRQPGFNPYKFAVEGLVYLTNLQVHEHALYFDWLRVNDLPLRVIGGIWFFAT